MRKALYILAELSDREFEWLLRVGRLETIPAGVTLIHEGDPISALYLVLDGTLSVTIGALGGREIARLSAGDVVGEMSFLDRRSTSATVRAVGEVLLWSIVRSQLAAKLSEDSSFAAHFYHALGIWLSHRLRGTMSRLGYSYGYGKDEQPAPIEQFIEQHPDSADNVELAKIRLACFLDRMKSVH